MRPGGKRGWGGFIVMLVGGFAGAFFFGRTTTVAEYDPMPSTGGGAGSLDYDAPLEPAAPASAPVGDGGEGELGQQVEELQREIAAYEQLAEVYEEELYGVALEWPAEMPALMTPEGFEAQARKAVAECGAGVDITGFDCSEPPCFMLLRVREEGWREGLVENCPAWKEPYGTMTSGASFAVECADGSEEQVEMLGVPVRELLGLENREQRKNLMKRLKARMMEQELRWTCAGEEG